MDRPADMFDEIDALLSKLKTLPDQARMGLVTKIQDRLSEMSSSSNGNNSSKYTFNDKDVCPKDGNSRKKFENADFSDKEVEFNSIKQKNKKKVCKQAKSSPLYKDVGKRNMKICKTDGRQDCVNKRRNSVLPVRYTNFTDVPDFLVPNKKNDTPNIPKQQAASKDPLNSDIQIEEVDDSIGTDIQEPADNSHDSKNEVDVSSECCDTDVSDNSSTSLTEFNKSGIVKKKRRYKKTVKKDDRTCNLCARTYVNPSYLRIHMRKHTGEKPYRCETCDKSFSQKSSLWVHTKRHEGKFDHKCTMCDYKSVLKIDLLRHTSKHTGKKIFICELCGKMFTTDMRLKDHIRHVHERSETHVCDKCGFATHRADNLRRHIAVKHSDDEYFKCPVCSDVLKQRSTFIVHLRRHTGERPHLCKECGKGFKSLSQVAVHRRTHREGQHVCPECNHKFKTKHHLDRHSVIHTGVKPYSCTYCSYSCNVKGNINKHMKAVHKLVNFSFRKQKQSDNDSVPTLSNENENAAIARGTQVAHEFLERISLRKDEQLTIEELQKQLEKPPEPREEIPIIKNKPRSNNHNNKRTKQMKSETCVEKNDDSSKKHLLTSSNTETNLALHTVSTDNFKCAKNAKQNNTTSEELNLPICTMTNVFSENVNEVTICADGNSSISVPSTCLVSTDNKIVRVIKSNDVKNQNPSNVLFLSVKEVVDENFSSTNSVTSTIPISNLEQEHLTDSSTPTIYLIRMDP